MISLGGQVGRFWWLLLTGLVGVVIALWPTAAGAKSSDSDQESLASCELQVIQPQSGEDMLGGGVVFNATSTEDTLSYRRTAAGDWVVPQQVDPDERAVRGLLMTPAGPILVQAIISINDQPFRATREQWIDAAITPDESEAIADETGVATQATNDEQQTTAAVEAPEDSAEPTQSPQRFVGQSPRDWLVNYVQLAETPVDRFEARWLLAQRAGGPTVMELQRFSKSRSAQAPLVHFIDSNGDKTLDQQELASAADRLVAADYNQDGGVDLRELSKATSRGSRFRPWTAQPMFAVADDATEWNTLARQWKVSEESLVDVSKAAPSVLLSVSLGTAADASGVQLIHIDCEEFASDESQAVRTRNDAIAVRFAWGDLEFAAGQATSGGEPSQISLGATTEGAPLWSLVDSDQDNRLSIRERGKLMSLITELDIDASGDVEPNEIPSRIRWAVALGPRVHQLLLKDSSAISNDKPESNTAPDWFVSMDGNRDGDLTKREFLGTAQQFDLLDENEDGLVSAAEASK